jgi:predicted acyl esterase
MAALIFERGSRLRLQIAQELWWHRFQSDAAPHVQILRLVNNAHPTAAEPAGNAIVQDGAID